MKTEALNKAAQEAGYEDFDEARTSVEDDLEYLNIIHLAMDIYAGGWISVEERLPEVELVVIVSLADGDFTYRGLGYLDVDGRWYKGASQLFNVTHWQPLPTAP